MGKNARNPDFPYNKNSVQFTLSSPSSVYPQHTFFRYRLSGGSTAPWQQTAPGEKKISFASLEPGNYVFEAAAINFQNNASKPVTYSFRIEKPWWTQEWFIGFMVMLVLGFFYGLYLLRLNQILKVEKMRRVNRGRRGQGKLYRVFYYRESPDRGQPRILPR